MNIKNDPAVSNYFIEMTGRVFGELTVVRREKTSLGANGVSWFCRCSCGQFASFKGADLRTGRRTVCGSMHGQIPEDAL
jgi:hypothetical protein